MRRILIDNARRKGWQKRGGGLKRVDLNSADLVTLVGPDEVLLIRDAIQKLDGEDGVAAQLVKPRYRLQRIFPIGDAPHGREPVRHVRDGRWALQGYDAGLLPRPHLYKHVTVPSSTLPYNLRVWHCL